MKSVAIVGAGLIGSSFGLALRQAGFDGPITGVSSPPASRYSAEHNNSSSVAAMPRFSSTGLRALPSSRNRLKFCMLRAPT